MYAPTSQQFQFRGDPVSQAMGVRANRDHLTAQTDMARASASENAARMNAQAGLLGTLYQQPAAFANVYGNAWGSQAGALSGLSGAMANERSNWYGANAMAEAARQTAAANIGAAGLGAYGNATNGALQAWAANQTAYNRALSDMVTANQAGLAGYGASRNQALGGIGAAQAAAAPGIAAANASVQRANIMANAARDIMGGMPGVGGGFSARGAGGGIASGSFGGGGGGRGWGGGEGGGGRGWGGGDLGGGGTAQLMAGDITGDMRAGFGRGLDDLRAQQSVAMGMPGDILSRSLRGIQGLGEAGYGQLESGMNQFYATQNNPRNWAQFGGVLDSLNRGYSGALNRIGDMAGHHRGDAMALRGAVFGGRFM